MRLTGGKAGGSTCRAFARILATIFLLVGIVALPPMAAPRTPPKPLLWEVSDAENRVFLLGTFHPLTPDDYPPDTRVDEALAAADVVYLELAPEAMSDPSFGERLARVGLREDEHSLQQSL